MQVTKILLSKKKEVSLRSLFQDIHNLQGHRLGCMNLLYWKKEEKRGESLLCFMLPKEPSLAACTGLNHMGALNSCTLMDLSPGASTSLPASGDKQTRTYVRVYTSQTERVQWRKGPPLGGSPSCSPPY
jgi:hypothetical protein